MSPLRKKRIISVSSEKNDGEIIRRFSAARKVLKDARHRLCSLFDVRRHISAHVFVSIFLSVLLISTFLISAYSLNAMNDLTQVSVLSGQSAVDTIASQIDTFVDNIAQTHVLLFSSENVYPFLYDTSVSMPSYEWFQGYHDAQNMLRFCGRSQYNLISGMLLQKSASEKLQYGGFNALIDPYSLKPDELNRLLLRDGFAFYVSSTSLGDGSNAYLYSQIYNSAFDSLCRGLLMPDSGLVLLDAEGSVFRRYEDGADAAGQIDAYLAGRAQSVMPGGLHCAQSTSPQTGLTVAMVFPAMRFSEKLSEIIPWLLPAALFALVAGFLLSFGLSRKVVSGFQVMQNNIRLVESRAYGEVAVIPSQDEFGQLSRTFAHMAAHIDALIRENQERERTQHELEIQVLRAQISPHFLYNALNSVRHLASMQGMDHIDRLTGAIIRLLRAALSNTEALIPLSQEIEYVRNYCEICQYQYLNDFSLDIEVDETLMECRLPPMVLQPIVENAIIHGIADFRSDGVIRVHAQKNADVLFLTVTDNGQGMSGEQIDELLGQERNTDKRRFSGIGIQNVRKRIQMRFGSRFGLNIFAEPGKYTTVQLSLPFLSKEPCE